MNLTDIVEIKDFSNDTLLSLAERLEQSRTFQEFIMREVELDEIYRRVDTAVKEAYELDETPQAIAGLERLAALVFEAHDLAAEGEPLAAARRLRQAMTGAAG